MSPQTRRGRAQPAGRKPAGRHEAAPKPTKAVDKPTKAVEQPAVEAPEETFEEETAEVAAQPQRRAEGKRLRVAPTRKKRQHGVVYRWVKAYLPIMGGLFILLAALWIWTAVLFPPPPTAAQQWTTLESKWSPAREKARVAIAASTLDFPKQQAAYKDFATQTKGWLDAVDAFKDWGIGATSVGQFETDGGSYLALLQQVETAKTPADVAALESALTQADTAFTTDVAQVRLDLILSVEATAPPIALPSVNPTPTPVPSGSPGASSTPAPTDTPAVTPTPTAVPS